MGSRHQRRMIAPATRDESIAIGRTARLLIYGSALILILAKWLAPSGTGHCSRWSDVDSHVLTSWHCPSRTHVSCTRAHSNIIFCAVYYILILALDHPIVGLGTGDGSAMHVSWISRTIQSRLDTLSTYHVTLPTNPSARIDSVLPLLWSDFWQRASSISIDKNVVFKDQNGFVWIFQMKWTTTKTICTWPVNQNNHWTRCHVWLLTLLCLRHKKA